MPCYRWHQLINLVVNWYKNYFILSFYFKNIYELGFSIIKRRRSEEDLRRRKGIQRDWAVLRAHWCLCRARWPETLVPDSIRMAKARVHAIYRQVSYRATQPDHQWWPRILPGGLHAGIRGRSPHEYIWAPGQARGCSESQRIILPYVGACSRVERPQGEQD